MALAQPLTTPQNPSFEAESCYEAQSTADSNGDGSISLNDTPIESLINERKFLINYRIPGNDASQVPQCVIDDSICDLCLHFIGSSLNRQSYTYPNSRWDARGTWFDSLWHTRMVFRHYSSSRTLVKSASAGCGLCSKVVELSASMDDDVMVLGGKSIVNKLPSDYQLPRDGVQFSIFPVGQFLKGLDTGTDIQFEFALAEDQEDCLKMPIELGRSVAYSPSFHSNSDECFGRILRWYNNCTSEHRRCLRSPLSLPLRLLHLSSNVRNHEQVTLVESRDLPATSDKVRYVALSYCWGEQQEFITTTENLANNLEGIDLEQLPAVVRDAIYICKRCEIEYLWVDALCICQNDAGEWHAEAAKMAAVYAGCEFALSALSCHKSSENILRDRSFRPIQLGTANVLYNQWQDSLKLFARRRPRSIQEEFERCPLNKRAWPLQERILAPAVLHYGRDQLMWECNSQPLTSETGETQSPSDVVIRIFGNTHVNSSLGMRNIWEAIVEEYTRRKITYSSDRLPAVSGIASKLRLDGILHGRYVAGLWEEDLDFQIAWQTDRYENGLSLEPTEPNCQIPTWSWAHQNLPVRMFLHGTPYSALRHPARFHFQIQEHDERSRTETMVQNCAITLQGFVQKVSSGAIYRNSRGRPTAYGHEYEGLPGKDSTWIFDRETLGAGPYSCLRVLESDSAIDESVIYYLVLEEDNSTRASKYNHLGVVYIRVGILWLNDVPAEYSAHPYSDVKYKNGNGLLTNGEWKDVVLL
ncbi:heterokaryon incompatibility protein-domain-containing protein [Tricladium varicosporioides]|nr:heterokaryon incompatibility protein-domain-containing protein [Hymenoscyphus varicosporioides]